MSSSFNELWGAHRNLQQDPSSEINTYTSIGFIVWYCFVILCCGVPICCSCICYWMTHRGGMSSSLPLQELMRAMDEQQQEDLENEISRIEANIHAFTEEEQKRRKIMLEKTFKSRQKTLTKGDFPGSMDDEEGESLGKEVSKNIGNGSSTLFMSGCCSICLSKYEIGDTVISSTNPVCNHVFHTDCLVSWLMRKQKPLCPCCRQTFTNVPYDEQAIPTTSSPPPSVNSHQPPTQQTSLETSTDEETLEDERTNDSDEVARNAAGEDENNETLDATTSTLVDSDEDNVSTSDGVHNDDTDQDLESGPLPTNESQENSQNIDGSTTNSTSPPMVEEITSSDDELSEDLETGRP